MEMFNETIQHWKEEAREPRTTGIIITIRLGSRRIFEKPSITEEVSEVKGVAILHASFAG